MEDELIHELAAGYALNALSPEEERAYEEHLARCARCREEVAAFSESTAALGLATAADAPEALRERILAAARRERTKVVPLRPRWAYPAVAAAAVAACAAIGLGVWAATLHSRLASNEALHALPLQGATGSVVVAPGGQAALVVSGLEPPPSRKVYEVWVIRGRAASAAGLFVPRSTATSVVRLRRPVPAGARVGVTVEPAGGSTQPTTTPVVLSAPA